MQKLLFRYRWLVIVLVVACCLQYASSGDAISNMILAYQNGEAPVDTLRLGMAWVDSIYCRGYRLGWSMRSAPTEAMNEAQRITMARNHVPDSSLIFLAVYMIGFREGQAGQPNRVHAMRQQII